MPECMSAIRKSKSARGKNVKFLIFRHDCGVALQAMSRGTGGLMAWLGRECCQRYAACGAAEAVMSGFCILVLIMVMRQIHRITVHV